MRSVIQNQLTTMFNQQLVDELLDAHEEAKRNYYLGGNRLAAVEGGRFCEAAFRILESATTSPSLFTPIGQQLDTQRLIRQLENLPSASYSDSLRLHIPRALRMVYDIRNKRDAAHLADGIDPNIQDATIVVSSIDWVLAELIRLYHNVPPNQAQKIVETIVTRKAPVIQDFEGFPKVLKIDIQAGQFCLLLLYHRGTDGATFDELREWVRPQMVANLKATLSRLVDDKAFAHYNGERYFITQTGQQDVESRRLLEP